MGGNENKRLATVPHVTVFDLMSTIYNYMSECYTRDAILKKAKAVSVVADEISQELLAELEGLEP